MSENKHISIPKKVETEDQLDFHFLRRTGVKYIEELGGKLWTDYNSHDPGITTLEVLSYAITDLGMRMNLDIEDILTSDDESKNIDKQFVKASDILPSRPVNELDYRKLFIDISSVSDPVRPIVNCWLLPHKETMYADCKTGNLSLQPGSFANPQSFDIKGLYDLYVDYAQDALNDDVSECDKSNARKQILERYHANRSLCEDIVDIREIQTQKVAVCARINLENKADEEFVHAKILRSINNYLAPEIHFYSLNQMLEKGYTTDQIFDGPVLDNGFIDTEELKNSQLRREVRLSDIISEIMKIEGVKEILEISIAGCDSTTKQSDDWLICIQEGSKPELCDLSSFSYSKGSLPLNINQKQVNDFLDAFKKEEAILRQDASANKMLDFPEGTFYDVGNYSSILNEFPDTYGIGTSGIPDNPTPERQALAKQLKGYLLFFDKVLASYFKHLDKVKELLSVNGTLKKTYFTQALKGIEGFEELVNNYAFDDDDKLTDSLYEELDNSVERRNDILDHLISRFAETFSDYTFLMKSLYGKSTDEIVLSNKEAFLKEYKTLSADRGLGYNYTSTDLWDSGNVSGLQKRIARLLGIKNYNHRNVSESPVMIINSGTNEEPVYTWKIKDGNSNIILSSSDTFEMEYQATEALHKAVYQTIQIDQEDLDNRLEGNFSGGELLGNIQVRASGAGNFYLEILDDSVVPVVIARHRQTTPYTTQATLKKGINQLVCYFKYKYSEEGVFLVEHLLLKPAVKDYHFVNAGIGCMSVDGTFIVTSNHDSQVLKKSGEPDLVTDVDPDVFMDTCEDGCETDVFDPYSYRVSIVLPGYTRRFAEPDFRRFAETLIREELPAHVLAKICWVGDRQSGIENAQNDLYDFEKAFKKYLSDKASDAATLGGSTEKLLLALTNLNNIYRPGRLLDCTLDNNEDSLDGKIILGQSNI